MTEAPSAFSATEPRLQRAWDATSLSALMRCPRYYEYTIIEGWRAKSAVDLEFGGMFASACEVFAKARVSGKSRDEAQLDALTWALEHSGERTDGEWHPWSGTYVEQWHCTGTEKYRNEKGNPAKCPYAKVGIWMDGRGPSTCSRCGSATEARINWVRRYVSPKDRYTLVRLVIWYCEEQSDEAGLQPYAFPDGTPAVELSFKMPLPWRTPAGEQYILCGHLDSIKQLQGEFFVCDNKSTKKPLTKTYFSQYAPNVQVDTYDLAGSLLFPTLGLSGVLIEGAQVLESGVRFANHISRRNDEQREEFLHELEWWLERAEEFAASGHYPMNRAACPMCSFRDICSKSPASRERWLSESFERKHWNPLEER